MIASNQFVEMNKKKVFGPGILREIKKVMLFLFFPRGFNRDISESAGFILEHTAPRGFGRGILESAGFILEHTALRGFGRGILEGMAQSVF